MERKEKGILIKREKKSIHLKKNYTFVFLKDYFKIYS